MDNWGDALVERIADRVFERIEKRIATSTRIGGDKLTYSEHEASELLGVPKHVLKGMRERGQINPPRIGKSYRYSLSSLIELAENRQK